QQAITESGQIARNQGVQGLKSDQNIGRKGDYSREGAKTRRILPAGGCRGPPMVYEGMYNGGGTFRASYCSKQLRHLREGGDPGNGSLRLNGSALRGHFLDLLGQSLRSGLSSQE